MPDTPTPATAEPTVPDEDPDPASQRPGLGRRAARGAVQTMGASAIKIVVQVLGVVVLARLLSPHDYGLVAMVTAVVGVAEIFRDFGLSAAAVQAPSLTRRQRDNLFWINTGAGLVLTGIVIAGAPGIAMWYHRPELVWLSRIIAFIFLLNGMTTQFRADLNRRLQFSKIAIVDISAPAAALGLAIVAALNGAGYWALVAQQLATSCILLLGTACFARWLPRLPHRSEPMGDLLSFGWHLAGSQFVGYLGNNVDSLVIGTRFGASPLGLYNRAFQLLMTPLGQLRQPTTTVSLPILSRLRPDVEGSNRYVHRGQMALGLTIVCGLGFVVGAASPVVAIFLGDQWLAVTPVLRLLAVAAMFQTLAYVGYWVYLAHGLTKDLLHYTFITVAIKIACILVGSEWGMVGVAWGYAVAPAIAWPVSFWWLSRKSTIRVRPLFGGAALIIGTASFIAAGSWAACLVTERSDAWVQLPAGIGAAAACYAFALLVLRPLRREFGQVLSAIRTGLRQRQRNAA